MTKRDKNFRLSKTVKRMLAGKLCRTPSDFKKSMIEAQIASSIPIKSDKKNKQQASNEA